MSESALSSRHAPRSTVVDGLGLVLVAAGVGGGLQSLGLATAPVTAAAVALAIATALVVVAWRLAAGPPARFNAADRATLLRAALTAVIAGHLLLDGLTAVQAGCLAGLAVAVLLLDGVDGYIARRWRLATAFGARLDMEVDAALILALAALLWRHDRAGAWVLAIGGLRYAFLAWQRLRPRYARALPESRRRKTACVVQMGVLPLCLLPGLPASATTGLAAAALALLCYSFTVDVFWLVRHPLPTATQE